MAKLEDNELVGALANARDWVDAGQLARMFRVTPKTVYNHVRRINEQAASPVIESSARGYLFVGNELSAKVGTQEEKGNRADAILGRLLGPSSPLNIYDLADELHIADSTLQTELRNMREETSRFGIKIERKRDMISLSGSERDKRRLINHLITSQGSEGFAAFASSQLLNNTYESISLIGLVSTVLKERGLTCNDYGINNIVLHLTVMIDRLRQGQTVDDDTPQPGQDAGSAWHASEEICSAISAMYKINTAKPEIYYLALTIALNTKGSEEGEGLRNSVTDYLSADEIEQTREIVAALEQAYCLEPFDDAFETRLALHFHDLRKRAESGTYARNPLVARTKSAYPLVYDMAVFVANEFSTHYHLSVNEHEIAFLAFHIGGYFENNLLDTSRITCTLLYIGYHEMHLAALERINKVFGGEIVVTNVSSVSACNLSEVSTDLVLSPVPVNAPHARTTLIVKPILTNEDLDDIRTALDTILAQKRSTRMQEAVRQYLRPDLFRRNYYVASRNDMIRDLARDCVVKGLCNEDFFEDVLRREAMSSTAIGNQVAIPHSLAVPTRVPFFSVVVNDKPMEWDDQRVSLVVLIGINKNSRSSFRILFDDVLAILSKPANIAVLLECKDYDDFISRLEGLLSKRHESA